jgi:thiamine transport system ATP-binding protein
VSVGYGAAEIVHGVDLAVAPGEVVALLGPSGCGKSTLLRAIAGLEPLRSGTITWNGDRLDALPTHRRGVGLMFQHHALFPHRNVGDNVGFGLRMAGVAPAQRRLRVDELLALVGLDGYRDRRIDTLSGGEAQRVALARALAPEPRVLLLDEPLGALDRALRERLAGDVRSIIGRLAITAIHVTHDQDEAATVADRVALMAGGRFVAIDEFDVLQTAPPSAEVARFLGIETLWPLRAHDGTIASPVGVIDAQGRADGDVTLLLRPADVRMLGDRGDGARRESPESARLLRAVVVDSRVVGAGWLTRCRLDDGALVVASGAAGRLPPGTSVTIVADVGAIAILDD